MTEADIRGDVVRLILDVDTSTVHVDPELTPDTVAAALYRAYLAASHKTAARSPRTKPSSRQRSPGPSSIT